MKRSGTEPPQYFFPQNSTLHQDATFNGEKLKKLWAGRIKRPSSNGGLLGKNSPSLATHSYLSIIPKVALIQLNSCQGLVNCCVLELRLDNTKCSGLIHEQPGWNSLSKANVPDTRAG